jgi:hypothetical protein
MRRYALFLVCALLPLSSSADGQVLQAAAIGFSAEDFHAAAGPEYRLRMVGMRRGTYHDVEGGVSAHFGSRVSLRSVLRAEAGWKTPDVCGLYGGGMAGAENAAGKGPGENDGYLLARPVILGAGAGVFCETDGLIMRVGPLVRLGLAVADTRTVLGEAGGYHSVNYPVFGELGGEVRVAVGQAGGLGPEKLFLSAEAGQMYQGDASAAFMKMAADLALGELYAGVYVTGRQTKPEHGDRADRIDDVELGVRVGGAL